MSKPARDPYELYGALSEAVSSCGSVSFSCFGRGWAMAAAGVSYGLAMATEGDSIAPLFPDGLDGLPLSKAARAVKSWNFREASQALAAVNAGLNTSERMEVLDCYLPFERHYSEGMDFHGKTVGMIGHMHGPAGMAEQAKEVYIIEKAPQPGDYPDSACDYILPRCDIVLITGSSIVNKTLPHLLTLCENAYTVLTGPSVPMCPKLLDFGIDRLAGLVLTEPEKLRRRVLRGEGGSPYPWGKPFVLKK